MVHCGLAVAEIQADWEDAQDINHNEVVAKGALRNSALVTGRMSKLDPKSEILQEGPVEIQSIPLLDKQSK